MISCKMEEISKISVEFGNKSVSKCTSYEILNQLVKSSPKGVFLLDDPPPAIGLRLTQLHLPNKQIYRKQYYELFASALNPRYLCAISMSEEVLEMHESDKLINDSILTGLRLDMGIVPLNYNEIKKKECYTEGLEYLDETLNKIKGKGITFTRWRSLYTVAQNKTPTYFCLTQNCKALARFAKISQSHGMIPIAEVELLKAGNYSLELGSKVLEKVLAILTKALIDENVNIKEVIVQVNIVSGGERIEKTHTPQEMALATVGPMKTTLPAGLGGIAFSSGGLGEEEASLVLNAIAQEAKEDFPWPFTFAFGRALQQSAIKTWAGDEANIASAQEEFNKRQEANTRAMSSFYSPMAVSTVASTDDLYADQYVY